MIPLVQKEFVQTKRQLLHYLVFIAAAILIFGRVEPSVAMAYLLAFPLALAANLPQISFAHEERENSLAFLRTLPIPPGEIVGSKFVFTAVVIALFQMLLFLASAIYPGAFQEGLWAMASVMTLAAAFLSAVSLLLHYWVGLKSARTFLMIIIFALALPFVLLQLTGTDMGGLGVTITELFARADGALGLLISSGIGAVLMLISWSISTRIFASRDLSRMK